MRALGVVAALLFVYAVYFLMASMFIKPAFEQFHHGIQEFNHEIQRFDEGQ